MTSPVCSGLVLLVARQSHAFCSTLWKRWQFFVDASSTLFAVKQLQSNFLLEIFEFFS
jgi:hypothetical protein